MIHQKKKKENASFSTRKHCEKKRAFTEVQDLDKTSIKTILNNQQLFTLALNSDSKSKCLFRSVARMASIARNLKRLNSTVSSSHRKLYFGSDMRRAKAAAA